jgi:hypothetical protein
MVLRKIEKCGKDSTVGDIYKNSEFFDGKVKKING